MQQRIRGFIVYGLCWLGVQACAAEHAGVQGATERLGAEDALVRTDRGLVRGVASEEVLQFWAIPYAKPPVGTRRWRAPEPMDAWNDDVRDATEPGPRCAQSAVPEDGWPASEAEDCLYLNVTVPAQRDAGLLPVMVWIHGGGYYAGSNLDRDPRRLAQEGNVIVVSINYRLGALGFFAYPGLAGSGTFGLQDQQAALRWVRDNALAFHGDPENVTIFGESAGGSSVCAHLAASSSAGLFERAIIQSESCSTLPNASQYIFLTDSPVYATWKPLGWAESIGTDLAAQLGCGEPTHALECLRETPVAQWLSSTTASGDSVQWGPVYETELLPEQPGRAVTEGAFNKVPVLAGTTRDEGSIFAQGFDWVTPELYPEGLTLMFAEHAAQVAERYPLTRFESPAHAWSQVITDAGFACPALKGDQALAEHVPVYAYEFADPRAPRWFDYSGDIPLGVFHGAELPYLVGVAGAEIELDADQLRLSQQMIGYWSRFAATGNPNSDAAPAWQHLRAETPSTLPVLSLAPGESGVAPVDLVSEHQCDLWWSLQ